MKKVALLFAVAFVAAPAFANSPNTVVEEDYYMTDCHQMACEVASQMEDLEDAEDAYEMAYEYCTNG